MATKKTAVTKKTVAKKIAATKKPSGPVAAAARLLPPDDKSVVIRMYRIGHGDCFLLAFPGEPASQPVYVLIDCGYKPGSNGAKYIGTSAKEVTTNIREATGGKIDVAIITHEHQDHVNGITENNFKGIDIAQTWLAWTEDPNDEIANRLRVKFKDQLHGLINARNSLAAAGGDAARIDRFLAFELGGEEETLSAAMLGAAAKDSSPGMNKTSMKVFKDKAGPGNVKFLRPHEKIWKLPRSRKVRVYPLGPPRDPDLIDSLDPEGEEGFHLAGHNASAMSGFSAAARAAADPKFDGNAAPFSADYCLALKQAAADGTFGKFFKTYYDSTATESPIKDRSEAEKNPSWRRIDTDWLMSAESLALAMNSKTNNASLVLAFEIGKDGKVLLFAADAQRGNWISWGKKQFKDGSEKIDVKELLARCVLYKVGHHGSHNATLDGKTSSDWANLSWLGANTDAAQEFTAMITAVRKWAETQDGWDHPLESIKTALIKKAEGRLFQTDTEFDTMEPRFRSKKDWTEFKKSATEDRLYFDFVVKES